MTTQGDGFVTTMDDVAIDATTDLIEVDDASLTREEIGDPEAFLDGDRGRAWLAPILSGAYYTRWFDADRSSRGLRHCNELACDVIAAKLAGHDPEAALESHFSGGEEPEDVYENDHADDVRARVERLSADLEDVGDDLPGMDVDEWVGAVRHRVIDHMDEGDTSGVLDMFGAHDRCEIVFRFNKEGESITTNNHGVVVDDVFADVLAGLGHSVAAWRKAVGAAARSPLARSDRDPSRLTRRRRVPRSRQLCSIEQLVTVIDNGGGYCDEIVLYAVVPLIDLVKVDLGRPILLDRYSVAAWDGLNGSFFEITIDEALLIEPGTLAIAGIPGSSPAEDLCHMTTQGLRTPLRNPAPREAL